MPRKQTRTRSRQASIQLRWLAHARSGDKGDTANVGLIALEPEYFPILVKQVTTARVQRHFKGMVRSVDRFVLPNLNALNFLLHGALDGEAPSRSRPMRRGRSTRRRCFV